MVRFIAVPPFRLGVFSANHPAGSIPKSSLIAALKRLTEEGLNSREGSGRSTFYVRADIIGFDFGQITSMKISFDGSAECEPYYNNPMDDVIYMIKKL